MLSVFNKNPLIISASAEEMLTKNVLSYATIRNIDPYSIFPNTSLSTYSVILIEYHMIDGSLVPENLQQLILAHCNRYLSGSHIEYRLFSTQEYLVCWYNYDQYGMRTLIDSLKQILYNLFYKQCRISTYFSDGVTSPEIMVSETEYLIRFLHYREVWGYWKRYSSNFIRMCEASDAKVDEHALSYVYSLLQEHKYAKVTEYLLDKKEDIRLFRRKSIAYSYNALFQFAVDCYSAIQLFFTQNNYTSPLLHLSLHELLVSHSSGGVCPLLDLLCDALDLFKTEHLEAAPNETDFIICVNKYMEHHLSDATLMSAATHFHVSAAHLSRIYKKNMNQNFSDYLSKLRLKEATQLLTRDNSLSIADISSQVGYSTPAYFLTKFKKEYGMTPNSYRRKYIQSQNR